MPVTCKEHDAVFDVEAGDVDGDGVDELFVYAGCYVDEKRRAQGCSRHV